MFKLLKLFVSLVVLGVLAYGVITVPFGEKTLYQHFRGISQTPEARDLSQEVSKKIGKTASEIKDEVTRKLDEDEPAGGKAGDTVALSDDDRSALNHILSAENGPTASEKAALEQLLRDKLAQN